MAVYRPKHCTHSRIEVTNLLLVLCGGDSLLIKLDVSLSSSNLAVSMNSPFCIQLTTLLGTGALPAPRITCDVWGGSEVDNAGILSLLSWILSVGKLNLLICSKQKWSGEVPCSIQEQFGTLRADIVSSFNYSVYAIIEWSCEYVTQWRSNSSLILTE